MFFYSVISPLCLYNTQYEQKYFPSMHNFSVAIINGSYMFQLHSSHHQAVYVRSIRGNFIPAAYIRLKLISGRYFGLTYKDTWMLHIKSVHNDLAYKIKPKNSFKKFNVETVNKSHCSMPVTQEVTGNMCGKL